METGKAIALVQKTILEHKHIRPDDCHIDSPYKDIGLDSLDITEVALNIEEQLHTEFTDAQLNDIKTIRDFANLVASVGEIGVECPTS